MKHTLSSKDFNWRDIEKWMRITLWGNNKIKKKNWLVIDKWEIKIIWWNFKFLEWDILVIIKTQDVKKEWSDKYRKEITFQVERDWKILENKWVNIEYIFSWRVFIHTFFPRGLSDLADILIKSRDENKWRVKDLLEVKK
jgi:hypothetical protein